MEVINNGDPRPLDEAMENSLNPFRLTENSMRKCRCGHTIGFHHLTGQCKGALWGCECTCPEEILIGVDTGHPNGDRTVVVEAHDDGQRVVIDEVHTFKCGTCFDTGEVAEMIHDTGDDMPGGGVFVPSGRMEPCPICQSE